MKKVFFLTAFFLTYLMFFSCQEESGTSTVPEEAQKPTNYSQILLNYIADNSDFISSEKLSLMIDAKEVNSLIGSNIMIIDLRKTKDFSSGFIKGSTNIKFGEILDFYNKHQKRVMLERKLKMESGIVNEDSMNILRDFEEIDYGD